MTEITKELFMIRFFVQILVLILSVDPLIYAESRAAKFILWLMCFGIVSQIPHFVKLCLFQGLL